MNTKTKTKKTRPAPSHTTTSDKPCIFTPADRKRLKPLLSEDSFDHLMNLQVADPMPTSLIDSAGEEIDLMGQISINWWNDGNEQYIYQLGKRVYAYYDNCGDFLLYDEAHVTRVIEYSYPCVDSYWEEKCVQFGIKPPLRAAKRSCSGYCRVWINTFYRDAYLRSNDLSGWAREENSEIIVFESYSAARRWIYHNKKEHHGYANIEYPRGHYLYNHNEYAPREYKICE